MLDSPSVVQSKRVSLFANGFLFVPVGTGDKKPSPATDWPQRARALTKESAAAWPDGNALNTGILADGLVPIDIDTEDAELAQWITSTALASLGPAPIRSRDGSPRCLLLYRSSDTQQRSSHLMDAAGKKIVEVLGVGRQFVAYGLHPSKAAYRWTHEPHTFNREALTEVTPEQVASFLATVAQRVGGNVSRSDPQNKQTAAPQSSAPVPTPDEQRIAAHVLTKLGNDLRAMRAGEGRNTALNLAALQMGELCAGWGIERQPVADALIQAAYDNRYVAKDGIQAARETLASGFAKGLTQPRARHVELPDLDITGVLSKGAPSAMLSAAPKVKRSVVLTGLASVQEASVEWLWPGYLPAGMLTLLAGAGGTGKSTVAFNFAAIVTRGGLWPDGKPNARVGNVLIWSSEDDVARTIKPRLMAAGADLKRVAVIEGMRDETGTRLPFDPATDMQALRDAVREIGGICLLIIDPIVSAVAGDMHKANDVRRSLQPIVDFATEFNCAVFGITHFAKNTSGRNATERVIGSQAFAAFARTVLVTAKEEDGSTRVLTIAKSNVSEDNGGVHYSIEQTLVMSDAGFTIQTTRVVWGATIQGNARAILATVEGEPDEGKPQNRIQEAMAFLRTELANGPQPASELIARAKEGLGLNERVLQRARERLGIVARKNGYQGAWMWTFLAPQTFPG